MGKWGDNQNIWASRTTRDGVSRRGVLRGIAGGAGLALFGRRVSAQDSDAVLTRIADSPSLLTTPVPTSVPGEGSAQCPQIEGLQLLLDWLAQKVVIPSDQLVPPQDWKLFSTNGVGVSFLYPGDWTATPIWASSLTGAGAISWHTQLLANDLLWGVRLVSPDQQAIYEYVSGTLAGVALDLDQTALAAEQGVLGDGATIDPLCLFSGATAVNQNWTRGGTYNNHTVVIGGNVLSTNDPYLSATNLTYQTFIGPEDEFTSLVREIYIPIMFQFFMSSGGGTGDDDGGGTGDDDDDDSDDDDA